MQPALVPGAGGNGHVRQGLRMKLIAGLMLFATGVYVLASEPQGSMVFWLGFAATAFGLLLISRTRRKRVARGSEPRGSRRGQTRRARAAGGAGGAGGSNGRGEPHGEADGDGGDGGGGDGGGGGD